MKHTSTVLEHSIPVHTLVKLVDAEDIAIDKIRTYDLTLEVNGITKQIQTQFSIHNNKNNLCLHNHETQITRTILLTKKIALIVIEQIIPSQLVSKNNAMMKRKEMLMLDQSLVKNHLYNTFILLQTTEQNEMIHDIEVEVHHKIIIITKTTIHKIDIAQHLEISLSYDKNTTPP